eukprot:4632875-Lingulodinium_polyedra.AAC.1
MRPCPGVLAKPISWRRPFCGPTRRARWPRISPCLATRPRRGPPLLLFVGHKGPLSNASSVWPGRRRMPNSFARSMGRMGLRGSVPSAAVL